MSKYVQHTVNEESYNGLNAAILVHVCQSIHLCAQEIYKLI